MNYSEQNTENKKQSGNGNGNSVIDNHEKNTETDGYVSGDNPSSSSHKSVDSIQNRTMN